ncbi:hypothetical protein SAMN05444161_0867 [Rhizobiales bacterium GAS191]|jgi:hypothetical protein|nr:hypothetical protein SAMN05519103_08355 [Rhizobiales bacterium GAS113]SEC29642.1 hypothetical protein SAMN05444161_0867 [Rhizobiales bacterium GAS191]
MGHKAVLSRTIWLAVASALLCSRSASGADWSFVASDAHVAVAYTAERDSELAPYHVVIISNIGVQAIEVRLGIGERAFAAPYATIAPGAAASFVTRASLFVSCRDKACRIPVEVNYLASMW